MGAEKGWKIIRVLRAGEAGNMKDCTQICTHIRALMRANKDRPRIGGTKLVHSPTCLGLSKPRKLGELKRLSGSSPNE